MVVLSSRAVASKPDKPDASSALLVSLGQGMFKSPIPLFNHDICAGLRGEKCFFWEGGGFAAELHTRLIMRYVSIPQDTQTHS